MLSPTPVLEHMPPKRSRQLPLILATDYWICTSLAISTGFLSLSLLTIFNIFYVFFFFFISWGWLGCFGRRGRFLLGGYSVLYLLSTPATLQSVCCLFLTLVLLRYTLLTLHSACYTLLTQSRETINLKAPPTSIAI